MSAADEDVLYSTKSLWWLSSIIGILTLGVGVFFVVAPHETLSTITVIAGIFVVIDGLVAIVGSIAGRGENRGVLALVGVIGVVAGVVLIKHPFQALVVLTLIVGIWFVVAGIARFVATFSLREDRLGNILLALLDVIAGVIILAWPELGLATLAVIFGIVLILRGFLLTLLGFQLSRLPAEPRAPRPAT
jgi:uncharacterized membrane protein HdeD (DUF308 family)